MMVRKFSLTTAGRPVLLAAFALLFQTNSTLAAEPVKIGTLLELSGSSAPNGENCRRGIDLARAVSNNAGGVPVQTVIGDYKGEAKSAISEFQRIVLDPEIVAVLSTRSLAAMAINPLSKRMEIPLFATAGHSRLLLENPYAIRIYPSVSVEGTVLAQALIADKRKSIAVVTLEDDWTLSLEQAMLKILEQPDGPAVASKEHLLPGDLEFTSVVSRIKQQNVDAAVINLSIGETGTFIRRLREQLPDLPIYSNFWAADPSVASAAGPDNMDSVKYAAINLNKPKFQQLYAAAYPGNSPSAVSYACFAGMTAIASVMNAPGSRRQIISKPAFWSNLQQLTQIELPDETLSVKDREILFDVKIFDLRLK